MPINSSLQEDKQKIAEKLYPLPANFNILFTAFEKVTAERIAFLAGRSKSIEEVEQLRERVRVLEDKLLKADDVLREVRLYHNSSGSINPFGIDTYFDSSALTKNKSEDKI